MQVQAIEIAFHFAAFDLLRVLFGGVVPEEALAKLDAQEAQKVLEQLWQAVRPFEGSKRITALGEVLLGAGVNTNR